MGLFDGRDRRGDFKSTADMHEFDDKEYAARIARFKGEISEAERLQQISKAMGEHGRKF